MKRGCFFALAIYAAFVYGYFLWLGQTFEGKELWIASFIVGLIASGGVGALCNSYLAWRDGSVLSEAIVDLPRRDGRRTAVSGRIEPVGPPLTAPLSGKSCVLYEYEIYREVTRTKKGGGTETSKSVDFAGLGKTECVIRSTATNLRLIGFPDLDPLENEYFTQPDDELRAKQYVQFTPFDDASGMGVFHSAGAMFSALVGNDESLRKDWRMISVKDCAWLQPQTEQPPVQPLAAEQRAGEMPTAQAPPFPSSPAETLPPIERRQEEADVEDDGDFEDEDEDYSPLGPSVRPQAEYQPQLAEKRIEPGQQVVVIGRYDEVRQGLVSGGTQTIKIYLEDLQSVARKLASAKWGYLFGGIITLVIVNLGVWGAQAAYRNSDDAQRHWRESLEKAIRDGDVPTIEKMIKRGVNLNAAGGPRGKPVLFGVQDPAVARLLIERGADVNATDADGMTPLMEAAHEGRSAMLRVLIDAGADLDVKNKVYQTTALMMAIDAERDECVQMLRTAGAKDDTIRAGNGQSIDETHEAFAVCRDYLAAIFASDPARLRELSTRDRPARFDDVQWPVWQESRPQEPRLIEGYVRGDDATVTVTGPAPIGADRTWSYQLRREDGKWRVVRERWIVGVP